LSAAWRRHGSDAAYVCDRSEIYIRRVDDVSTEDFKKKYPVGKIFKLNFRQHGFEPPEYKKMMDGMDAAMKRRRKK